MDRGFNNDDDEAHLQAKSFRFKEKKTVAEKSEKLFPKMGLGTVFSQTKIKMDLYTYLGYFPYPIIGRYPLVSRSLSSSITGQKFIF